VVVDSIANVDPTISGTVANLAVAVGDSVKKGQLLFMIDDSGQLSASVAQAQASLQNAQIAVAQARANLAATKKKGSTDTERDRQILRQKIASSEQSLVATQLSYRNTMTNAAKREVVSPIAGTVNAINVKNGDDLGKVSSSSTRQAPIIIGDLGTLQTSVLVNEVDIPNVALGQKVTLTFPAINGFTTTGKVSQINALGTISQGVVTYTVTITFDKLDPRIRPEMSVSASIITGEKANVILVPSGAVKTQRGETVVQILKDGQTLPTPVTVVTGATNNTETEIVSGLNDGDNVVTRTIAAGAATTTTTPAVGGGAGGLHLPGIGGGGRG